MNTKNKYPLVSVIIPHYNGMDILSECLDSISKSTYSNIEIIVVDNNSADDSVQQLKEKYPSIKLLESAENLGFAGGSFRITWLLMDNHPPMHKWLFDGIPKWL